MNLLRPQSHRSVTIWQPPGISTNVSCWKWKKGAGEGSKCCLNVATGSHCELTGKAPLKRLVSQSARDQNNRREVFGAAPSLWMWLGNSQHPLNKCTFLWQRMPGSRWPHLGQPDSYKKERLPLAFPPLRVGVSAESWSWMFSGSPPSSSIALKNNQVRITN